MASRSGSGMGVTVALVVSIMLNLALILLVMLMYTKKDQAEQQAAQIQNDLNAFVKASERDQDSFKKMITEARSDGGKSVVAWQRDQFQAVMSMTTGNRQMARSGLKALMQAEGIENSNLLSAYRDERSRAENSNAQATSLQEQLDITKQRLFDQTSERDRMLANHQATINALNDQIGRMQKRADDYAKRVEDAEQDMDRRVADLRGQYDKQVADLKLDLDDSRSTNSSLTASLKTLQSKLNEVRPVGTNEGAIADGKVLEVLEDGSVFISLGNQDHIVLGMRFEVYGDASETRKDASGLVPLGKATVEVTRVDETTSMARVVRKTRGRAAVKGDILVNPIYDRNKTYSFYVFGNFDLDGVAGPTELETETVKSRIKEWGGSISDDFRGDIDFLVVGVQPEKPGPLPPNPSGIAVRNHVQKTRFYKQYQDYIAQAANLSIPVLNQNRLFTLIGYYGP